MSCAVFLRHAAVENRHFARREREKLARRSVKTKNEGTLRSDRKRAGPQPLFATGRGAQPAPRCRRQFRETQPGVPTARYGDSVLIPKESIPNSKTGTPLGVPVLTSSNSGVRLGSRAHRCGLGGRNGLIFSVRLRRLWLPTLADVDTALKERAVLDRNPGRNHIARQ
jgi:hypothetical protein